MACGCSKRASEVYDWTSDDGTQTMTYDSLIQAKAKVIREGGSYQARTV